jgi:3-hydroxyisobutyrate dehydrogenase-like beta-hydroxyacid dehydrogenase
VWNRSPSKYALLKETGAQIAIAETPAKAVAQSDIIFVMLFNALALDSIFTPDFYNALRGKTLVNTSSVGVDFNKSLSEKAQAAGGTFLEMPVSGSKVPAEQGQLVGLMAGDPEVADRIRPFVKPLTKSAVYCGPVSSGLKAKYAVNTLLITLTVGLSESSSTLPAHRVWISKPSSRYSRLVQWLQRTRSSKSRRSEIMTGPHKPH